MLLLWIIIAAVGAGILVHILATRREAEFEARFPPLGDFVEIDGIPVHAYVAGSGPDLVLIHGSSGNLRDFTFGIVDQLAAHYRVIALDRPGMGYSGRRKNETIFDQADVLYRAAKALGANKPMVLGQSYGGAVALAWGLTHQDDTAGLVLVSPATMPWNGWVPALYRMNGSYIGRHFIVPLLTAFVPQSYITRQVTEVFLPEPEIDGYADHVGAELAARRHSLRANAAQRVNLLEQVEEMHARYGDLTLPIEMIHGDADDIVHLDLHGTPFANLIETANLEVLEGAGHLPHHTRRDDMIAAVHRLAERIGLR